MSRTMIISLLVCSVLLGTISQDSYSRPSLREQVLPGSSYLYTGKYISDNTTDINITITMTEVTYDSYVATISSSILSVDMQKYMIDMMLKHRLDIMNLPTYKGMSHTSWGGVVNLVQYSDQNGTISYDKSTGIAWTFDSSVNNETILLVLDNSSDMLDAVIDKVVLVGGILLAVFLSFLLMYSLVIHPRLRRKIIKQKEVKIGAKRKQKTKK